MTDTKLSRLKRIPCRTFASAFCKQELRQVAQPETLSGVNLRLQIKPMVTIARILEHSEHEVEHIINELRIYCFLLFLMGMVGLFTYVGSASPEKKRFYFDFVHFLSWVETEPFKLIATFEVVAILFFTARLIIDLGQIRSLVLPPVRKRTKTTG